MPQYQKNPKSPRKCVHFPKSKKKQVQSYIGFVNYYRNYITDELLENFKAINATPAEACGLALRQQITGRQYVQMTNASFRASGYALMIEENDEKKLISQKKTFALVAFGSKVFSPPQLKISIYCKETLAIYHAFLE